MRVYPEKLGAQLKKPLLPVYLISSDEPLLQQEAADAVRLACREQGYSERQVFIAERSFNWNQLREASNSLSLFAEKRILELRVPSGKPGDQGAAMLQEYLTRPADDSILLILMPRLDGATLKTKWAKALQNSPDCAMVLIADITVEQLPRWLQQRLQEKGLTADTEVLQLISDQVEGNLLAAAQEIEKLSLLTDSKHLDSQTVQNAIADSARYDIFTLVDAALSRDTTRSLRILNGLRGEGQPVTLILWALTRDLRQLSLFAAQLAQGQSLQQVTGRVWPAARKPLIQNALQRHPGQHWQSLAKHTQLIDEQGKGQAEGCPWQGLEQLLLKL